MMFPICSSTAAECRVVVTGAGIVTALGVGWKANAEGFRAGRTAFRPVKSFDTAGQRVHLAAEVDLSPDWPVPAESRRRPARLDRAVTMLLRAASECLRQAGWPASEDLPMILGTTAAGLSLGEQYYHQANKTPLRHRGQNARALYYQAQCQGRVVAETLGFSGPITIVSNACASGATAVGMGWELIRAGENSRVLVGGYDALSQLVYAGFDSLQTLSATQCRPFDIRRDGLALGEGAAVLALESLESARRRGAEILAEVAGFGTALDSHHLTQPQPEGDAVLAAMTAACRTAGTAPGEVNYLNAHGTGTPLNDAAEARAIIRWAGAHAAALQVSSTKASIGHLLGGAGAVEALVCLMTLREQWLPPEVTLEEPDPLCIFQLVRRPMDAAIKVALSNSFGFGGVNASLIFRRFA